jgi:hypothetical protein
MKKGNPHYPVEALLENINVTLIKLGTHYEFNNAFRNGLNNKIKFILTDNLISDVAYISPQINRAVKNKSYFYNCYGKEEKCYIKNQG